MEKRTWAEISDVPSCETKMLHNAVFAVQEDLSTFMDSDILADLKVMEMKEDR